MPWFQSQSPIYVNDGLASRKRLVLREGEGIRVNWGLVVGTAAGLGAAGVTFQTGSATASELPTFSWAFNSAATANKIMGDIWNGSGANVLTITRVTAYPRPTAAVVGIVMTLEGIRTNSIGTGGTTRTADLYDTNDTLPSGITARDAPTGGAATDGGVLFAETIATDETSLSEYRSSFRQRGGSGHNTQWLHTGSTSKRPIVIRPGEGFKIVTGPLSGVGNVVVVVEATVV